MYEGELPGLAPEGKPLCGQGGGDGEGGGGDQPGQGQQAVGQPPAAGVESVLGQARWTQCHANETLAAVLVGQQVHNLAGHTAKPAKYY